MNWCPPGHERVGPLNQYWWQRVWDTSPRCHRRTRNGSSAEIMCTNATLADYIGTSHERVRQVRVDESRLRRTGCEFTEGVKHHPPGYCCSTQGWRRLSLAEQSIAEDLNVSERLVKTAYAAARHRGDLRLGQPSVSVVVGITREHGPVRSIPQKVVQILHVYRKVVHKTTVIRARNHQNTCTKRRYAHEMTPNAPPAAERGPEYVKTMDITIVAKDGESVGYDRAHGRNTPPPTPFCDEHPGGTAGQLPRLSRQAKALRALADNRRGDSLRRPAGHEETSNEAVPQRDTEGEPRRDERCDEGQPDESSIPVPKPP